MKKIFLLLSLLLSLQVLDAQTAYYITGSAVPDGVQQLVAFPNGQYKYAGTLYEGKLRVSNTPSPKTGTRYLKPTYEDSHVVNHGLPFTSVMARDSLAAEWTVPFSEDRYRFTVDVQARILTGELFTPWNECFMVGGATSCAWNTYTFLPFSRVENEICTWTWTGELKYRPENGEPRRFKIMGQNAWEPKSLHPFQQDADILTTSQLRTNGSDDFKWSVTKDGYYRVRVDIFRETCEAEYLGTSLPTAGDGGADELQQAECVPPSVYGVFDLQGRWVAPRLDGSLRRGWYVVDGRKVWVR